jgi:RNA polymerase sigma-70 factor (ECF subfamily)
VQRLLNEQPAASGAETVLFDLEYRREVLRWAATKVRGTVTPATWQAFWQTSVDGQAIPEVAQTLGITVGSVYIARSRIMAKLREAASRFEAPLAENE